MNIQQSKKPELPRFAHPEIDAAITQVQGALK